MIHNHHNTHSFTILTALHCYIRGSFSLCTLCENYIVSNHLKDFPKEECNYVSVLDWTNFKLNYTLSTTPTLNTYYSSRLLHTQLRMNLVSMLWSRTLYITLTVCFSYVIFKMELGGMKILYYFAVCEFGFYLHH